MSDSASNLRCPTTQPNTSVFELWTGEKNEDVFAAVGLKFISSIDDDTPPRTKADVLLEISRHPNLYADEVAERLGMSTKLVVELVGELIDEGILEYSE